MAQKSKPKIVDLLEYGIPRRIFLKLGGRISNGSYLYEVALGDSNTFNYVYFDESAYYKPGEYMALKVGKHKLKLKLIELKLFDDKPLDIKEDNSHYLHNNHLDIEEDKPFHKVLTINPLF